MLGLKIRKRVINWLLIWVLVLALPACSLFRPSGKQITDKPTAIDQAPIETLEARLRLQSETMSNINEMKALLRIQKDSIIWLNLNLNSGVLVAKAALYPDSFVIYNRIQQETIRGNYSNLYDIYGWQIDFPMLQAILLNQLLPGKEKSKSNPDPFTGIETIIREAKGALPLSATHLIQQPPMNLLTSQFITPEAIWIIDYTNFEKHQSYQFPSQTDLEIRKKTEVVQIRIHCDKLRFNDQLSFPFNLPKN